MKTKLFLTVAVAFFISSNLFAGEPKILTNITNSETGKAKEIILFSDYSDLPSKRALYTYDTLGAIQEKKIYEWNVFKGWEEAQIFVYNYNLDKLESVTLSRRSKTSNKWLSMTETQLHKVIMSDDDLYIAQRDI